MQINIYIFNENFVMPKVLKRFLKKIPLKIKILKYSIREYLSSK